jgi:hypothetical protein
MDLIKWYFERDKTTGIKTYFLTVTFPIHVRKVVAPSSRLIVDCSYRIVGRLLL